ncbi:hypothetical protein L486_05823 [Kwoniella mangroviensis CBS 10435]|uniref:Uncharacterized protein n=1 Tax=Kwoniella mangroviensis CBS 10435 TaxID=1331196 RepID=A0A1B9IN58_9TREE|nr:uncharacterized protein I203_03098 [Kwoniella mangroviensis CBS 8507]OCF56967.1 hypothetical protein L486_05823 [Kwoniella mangroviensis CBS 10435]OCF67404.1 hypothetical protein I203_03098 [Kwoniella mangroviensis CBS 8507]OCF75539.1 hypothetical protein I204_04395 [Kwoniella mangroviensis CBS 8886]
MSTDTLVSTSSTQHTTSTATAKPSPKIIVRDYAYTPVKVYEIIPQTQSPLAPSSSTSSSSTDSSKLLTPTTKEIPVIGLAREGEDVVVCESPECSDDEDGIVWMNNEGSNKGHT